VGEDRGEGGRERVVITKAELERARKAILANYEAAAAPTYQVETVTSLAKKEREAPARRRDTGLGLSWGRLVHQILEAIGSGRLPIPAMEAGHKRVSPSPAPSPIKGEGKRQAAVLSGSPSPLVGEGWGEGERAKLRSFIENILTAEEGDFSDTERLLAHVEAILGSPFWARVMKAEKRYFEIPFSIKTSQQELAELGQHKSTPFGPGSAKNPPKSGKKEEAEIPVILTGTIDLVFWEPEQDGKPGGWVIVDYKTDHIRPQLLEDDLADLVKMYAPQIRLYARFWSQTTGEPVKEAGLYFTSINRWVGVD
jgi:ATP-dependent helicase/nuclease subunit A